MKTWRTFLGIAELILAGIALYISITNIGNPMSLYGYMLAAAFGSKGLLYIITAGDE